MKDLLNITVADGKYTLIQTGEGQLKALRYGEEWRDLTGDNLTLALGQRIEELENLVLELQDQLP